ncbi:predicted protein [Plenodomus lingam JN3]|uniref:Predicted protein n=1 Tax=Leptosphaeria maculans (strain JN3 / isolate v23.1.3 / race Av1-4-5-6-7-8) TaxID=985895 RepID=E5A388_LEPMJ|nr:predicted protein [Plenodomus lingam JN3]CBX98101.1 predicted protein [Plenodomus lingam JN3]
MEQQRPLPASTSSPVESGRTSGECHRSSLDSGRRRTSGASEREVQREFAYAADERKEGNAGGEGGSVAAVPAVTTLSLPTPPDSPTSHFPHLPTPGKPIAKRAPTTLNKARIR